MENGWSLETPKTVSPNFSTKFVKKDFLIPFFRNLGQITEDAYMAHMENRVLR